MAKKLHIDLEERSPSGGVLDSAHQIWLAGLGAFARAQAEGGRLFESLVRDGHEIEERTRRAAGDTVESVRGRTGGQWDRIERVFEERVQQALTRLGVPTRADIQALTAQVEALNRSLQTLDTGSHRSRAGRGGKTAA